VIAAKAWLDSFVILMLTIGSRVRWSRSAFASAISSFNGSAKARAAKPNKKAGQAGLFVI
jgi:hypothetical protein